MGSMKLFRYRRPSLSTLLGITKAKKRIKKELGITDAMKPFRARTNAKRRFKRKIGYESEAGLVRNGLPRPGGCLVVMAVVSIGTLVAVVAALGRPWDVYRDFRRVFKPASDSWRLLDGMTRPIDRANPLERTWARPDCQPH